MNHYLLLAIISICLSANVPSPPPHDLRMSVCEIEYLPEEQQFELRFFLFGDDFRLGIYGDPLHDPIVPEEAAAYLLDHFLIRFNGEKILVKYKNMLEKAGQTQVQFRTGPVVQMPSEITIDNTILLEHFPSQVNMHFLLLPGQSRRSLLLKKGKTRGTFELK